MQRPELRASLLLAASLAALLAPALARAGGEDDGWEQIEDDDGIRVWRRAVEGSNLVEFRGRGEVAASLQDILAVIHDADRETEWMEGCNASFTIEAKSPLHLFQYNRIASPAPFISDRDSVVETKFELRPAQKMVHVRFQSVPHPRVPPNAGVVRMPKLVGSWDVRYLGPGRSEATYRIQADPGGALPQWIVNWASKSIPFDTIANLRKQVKKPGYDKHLMVLDVAIDWEQLTGVKTSTAAR